MRVPHWCLKVSAQNNKLAADALLSDGTVRGAKLKVWFREQISLQAACREVENSVVSVVSSPPSKSLVAYVPTARLAQLLVIARGGTGMSLEDMVEVFKGRFTVFQLMQLEAAILPINDDDLRAIAKAYGLDYAIFAPERGVLRIDLSGLSIAIGNHESAFDAGSDSTQILIRYLALLYKLRKVAPGEPLVLRDPDLNVLAQTYSCSVEQVKQALLHLMTSNVAEIRAQLKALTKRPSFLERLRAA